MKTSGKSSRKQRNAIIILVFLIPIVVGDVAIVIKTKLLSYEFFIPFMLTFAIFTFLLLFLRRKDGQKIEGDERNVRIEGRAFTYSWCLSLYAIFILLLSEDLRLFKISVSQCLFCILFVMLASNLIIRAILNRKGDIEE